MHSIIHKKSVKKPLIVLGVVLVLLLGSSVFSYAFTGSLFGWKPHQQSKPSAESSKNASDATIHAKDDLKAPSVANPNVDSTKTTDSIPVAKDTTVQITKLSQQNGVVTYAAKITNPGDKGTCSAVFTSKIDRPVTHTEPAKADVCPEMTIPETEFTSLGEWTLTLRYYINNTQAITTQTITIK